MLHHACSLGIFEDSVGNGQSGHYLGANLIGQQREVGNCTTLHQLQEAGEVGIHNSMVQWPARDTGTDLLKGFRVCPMLQEELIKKRPWTTLT